MTKEELEKEAYQFLIQATKDKKLFYFGGNLEEILAEFAEPREKQIEELEQKLEQTEKDLADYQFNYPTIKELQKEIAELKSEKGCETCTKFDEVQLSKAKEIIKSFITLLTKSRTALDTKTCLMKAEQFLKEVEK